MRYAVAAVAVVVMLASGEVAGADEKIALGAWLADCRHDRQSCIESLTFGYDAAYSTMAEVCPPPHQNKGEAAERELYWMEHAAASDPVWARRPKIEAEWAALKALWPCKD